MTADGEERIRFGPETRDHHVELTLTRDDLSGDLRVTVDVASPGFTARTATWIERAAWARFADALTSMARSRSGSASVASMSPGELEFTVRLMDAVGHVGVDGSVGHRAAGRAWTLRFDAMELDPTSLPELARKAQRWR